ncbi:protein lethal(2)denticleless [Ostrinia nubilalis]|uniref:protein lethal(2)denticleless n=1 Tax=Ostrinia nubilalis TaxID=29057 RepID=UPI0030826275
MNDIQCLIDRQLGIYCRFNYDNVLKRLVVNGEESFYGLQNSVPAANFDQDPPIFACRFSEAPGYEHILALANEDGRVAIQDTSSISSASTLEGFQCHNNAVFDLAWMPGYMNFVTVSGDHTACLWDVAEGAPKRIQVFSNHTRSVKTAVFRPTEPTVFATGARDGHILVWDIRTNSQPAVILKPDNCLMNCHSSFTPKTPGSHSKRPRIDTHRATSITGLVFQDDSTLISCGECDGNIKVWDMRKNYSAYKREPLPKHSIPYCGSSTKNGYTNLIIDDARVRLYASCMDNVIYCFNVSTYATLPERRYTGHENGTFYIKTGLSPDGAYLVSGSSDKHAYVWNVRCSEPLVRLAGHWAEVTCAAWGPRADLKLVTCSDDARHKIWRVGSERDLADAALQGRAEPAPRPAAPGPHWGGLDRTPGSLKRKAAPAPAAKRARPAPRASKRCLADLMAAREPDADAPKRPRRDAPPLAAGSKRRHPDGPPGAASPAERCGPDASPPRDWGYIPTAGSSFMTPTKNYERRTCKRLSPRSPKPVSPDAARRSPVKVSPSKVRIISYTTPTKNLPNFALEGEAPHLRLMSPVRKKPEAPDWLTLMTRARRGRADADKPPLAPLSPKENFPARRSSVSEKTPKSAKKGRTLLKYFSVTNMDKSK